MVAIFKKSEREEIQRMESAKETFRVKFLIESNILQYTKVRQLSFKECQCLILALQKKFFYLNVLIIFENNITFQKERENYTPKIKTNARKFAQQTMIERTCNYYIPQLGMFLLSSYLFSKLCSNLERYEIGKCFFA